MAFISPIPLTSCRTRRASCGLSAGPPLRAVPRHHDAPHGRRAPRMAGGPPRSTVADTPRKQFMERLKRLGKVRLITRNDAAIMEAIATFDGLFFAAIPSGEYANIVDMSINLDMHLLLEGVSGARFETGVSRSASKAPTYIVRVLGKDREQVALSVFLQWDREPADISPERIEAWHALKADYAGENSTFFFDE